MSLRKLAKSKAKGLENVRRTLLECVPDQCLHDRSMDELKASHTMRGRGRKSAQKRESKEVPINTSRSSCSEGVS